MEEFLKTGERIFALERMFNKREGFGRKDDTLPERLLKEPMPEGPAKGMVHPLEEMLKVYYEKRGYDEEGHPTEENLKELELICIVGLPCHVRAVRHLQHIKFELAPAIKFVIGLFCMANFEYEQMSRWIKERGMEMKDVEKMSTSKGFFNANTGDTKLSIPLKETEARHSKHCQACDDYWLSFMQKRDTLVGEESV